MVKPVTITVGQLVCMLMKYPQHYTVGFACIEGDSHGCRMAVLEGAALDGSNMLQLTIDDDAGFVP